MVSYHCIVVGSFQDIWRTNRAEKSVKYLGVTLDNQWKWTDHINLVSSKISKANGKMKYAKKVLRTNFCSIWDSLGPILDIVALYRVRVGPLTDKLGQLGYRAI